MSGVEIHFHFQEHDLIGVSLWEKSTLDEVFRCNKECVSALWEKDVFDYKCLPEKEDIAESLANSLNFFEMFHKMYVHVAAEEERLDNTNYPQPRRITYGVVHSEKSQVDS
jgi:hypothetical protein